MERLIFATGNEGKMREIRDILADTYPEILSMKEAGIRTEVAEDGKTYEENALIKARAVAAQAGELVLAGKGAGGLFRQVSGGGYFLPHQERGSDQAAGGRSGGRAHGQVRLRHRRGAAGRQGADGAGHDRGAHRL